MIAFPYDGGGLHGLAGAGAGNWAIPWPCVHEFLSIVSIRASMRRLRRPPRRSSKWMRGLESSALRLLTEAEEHWPVLRSLVSRSRVAGPKVHDARIAALCVEHGVRALWSADRDFSRFPEITVVNPLIEPQ